MLSVASRDGRSRQVDRDTLRDLLNFSHIWAHPSLQGQSRVIARGLRLPAYIRNVL
jgi:hypothetical protein